MDYDLELDKVAEEMRKIKAKKVCLQLPDGLKQHACEIVDFLKAKAGNRTQIWVWAGSNFGACDLPLYLKDMQFDLLVNFGHLPFRRISSSGNTFL